MESIPENNTEIACDNVDLNENNQSGLNMKGEAKQGIRTESSGISWTKAIAGAVLQSNLGLNDFSEAVASDQMSCTAFPVPVEECVGCGIRAQAGCGSGILSTLREEEEEDGDEDEISSSNNSDSCSVLSSSFDSLNSSTECLLLNVAHPQILSELPKTDAGVGELLNSMMEDKTSQLGKISMRCSNCLEKFHWDPEELEACLSKHLAQCWQKGVTNLSPIDENEVENELKAFEKEILRSEFSEVKSLVSAMLSNEWDLKHARCTPECNRDNCREVRNEDTIDSDDLDDTDIWDDVIGSIDACTDVMMKTEEVESEGMERKNATIEPEDDELNDLIVAEQRMLVFLVSVRESIWQDKMAAVLGLPTHATLDDLDSVLRRLWVECCGHASSLTMGQAGETFSFPDLEGGLQKLSITEKGLRGDAENHTALENLFGKIGATASYTYDPKRPTTLHISFMGSKDLTFTEDAEFPSHADFYLRGDDMLRPSHKSPMSSVVLLRNTRPEMVCTECHQSYVLLLDSGNMDLKPWLMSYSPKGAMDDLLDDLIYHGVGFCCMDCVVSYNEKMNLEPEHEDLIPVDRRQLVYMRNSPRAGMCRYASLELDSSISTEGTTHSAFTMDTSCSCADCGSDCSQNYSTCDYKDSDHSYTKSPRSPKVTPMFLRNAGTGGTPVLTGYNNRSTSVDTPPTRQ